MPGSDSTPKPPKLYDVPMGSPARQCTSVACSAPIYWIPTARSRMPIDCRPEHGGSPPTSTEAGRGIAHWAVCPDAKMFRGSRRVG